MGRGSRRRRYKGRKDWGRSRRKRGGAVDSPASSEKMHCENVMLGPLAGETISAANVGCVSELDNVEETTLLQGMEGSWG